jgi:hypothetical protein
MTSNFQISIYRAAFGDVAWRLVTERDLTHAQINAALRTVEARRSEVADHHTYRNGLVVDVDTSEPAEAPSATQEPEAKPASIARLAPASAKQAAKPVTKAEPASDDKAERIESAKAFLAKKPGASARDVAAHLGLTGSFAVQQATAALAALVKRGLANKENKDGATVYTLVKAAKKAGKAVAK